MTHDEQRLAERKMEELERSITGSLDPNMRRRAVTAIAAVANLTESPLRSVELLAHASDVEWSRAKLAFSVVTPERRHLTGSVLLHHHAVEMFIAQERR